MIAFGKDDSFGIGMGSCEILDECLTAWMNRMIRFANGMNEMTNGIG